MNCWKKIIHYSNGHKNVTYADVVKGKIPKIGISSEMYAEERAVFKY